MLHTVEEKLASIFEVYWTNRDKDMKADGLLTQVGLFFKRAGKKLTKIFEFLKEDDGCNAFLIEIAVCEWSMRKDLQARLDKMLSIGFPALPEPVLREPSQQEPKPKSAQPSKASSSALPRLAWNEEGNLVKDCVCVRLWHWASRLGVRWRRCALWTVHAWCLQFTHSASSSCMALAAHARRLQFTNRPAACS